MKKRFLFLSMIIGALRKMLIDHEEIDREKKNYVEMREKSESLSLYLRSNPSFKLVYEFDGVELATNKQELIDSSEDEKFGFAIGDIVNVVERKLLECSLVKEIDYEKSRFDKYVIAGFIPVELTFTKDKKGKNIKLFMCVLMSKQVKRISSSGYSHYWTVTERENKNNVLLFPLSSLENSGESIIGKSTIWEYNR